MNEPIFVLDFNHKLLNTDEEVINRLNETGYKLTKESLSGINFEGREILRDKLIQDIA